MKKIKALFSVLLCLMMICGYSVNYVSADDTEIVNETSSDITTPEEVNNEKEEENVKTENTETTNSEEETPKTETASTKEVPSAKAAGVTVNTDSATVIDLSQVEGDIYIASDGLHTGGTVTNTNFATSTYADGSLVADVNSHGYEFTGSTTTSRILVEKEITTNITLNNATISLSGYGISTHCIETSYADVTINLVGTNHLNVESQTWDSSSQRSGSIWKTGKAGTGKLTICGSGFLDASGPSNNYHTGGIIGITLYDVYIKDCTISASASYHQPAIGATCWGGNGAGNINISNAHVTAVGGYCCAAIGGGWGAPVDGIYIDNGSQVIATAGQNGSAIGSSYGYYGNGNVSNIVITGGNTKVTAYGSKVGNYPGIGTRSSSTVTNVTATPETNYQGYVKYGTSDTDYSYSTANPKTPFPTSEEFGTYLQNEAADGNPVYYTQVYFGPYKDNNDIDENAEIGSNDTVSKTGGAAFTEAQLKSLTNPTGHDKDGNAIDFSSYTLDADEVAKINAAKTAGLVGDFPLTYTYSYTDDEGKTHDLKVTSTVSLRENGTDSAIDASLPSIAANDANYKTGGAAFKDQELIELCDALANNSQGMNANIYDVDGNLTIAEGFTINADQKAALNAAKQAGETGDFPLTFTYTENGKTVTTTVTVSLRGNGTTNTDKKNSIPEMGSNDTIKKTGGSAYTADEVKTMTSLVAKDKDGNDLDLSKVVISQSDLDKLNDAKTAGKTGDFDITYTYTDEDGNKTTVTSTVSLRDNATTGTQGTSTAEQGGNDKTIKDSDGNVTSEELINECKVIAMNKNGAKVDTSTLTPNQEQLDYINKLIDNNCDGTYPMSWTTVEGEVITVNITLVPDTDNGKISGIEADDFTYPIKNGSINEKDALTLAGVELSGDRTVDLTNVTVDKTQLDYINQMIKDGKTGVYPLTFTDNITGLTVTINVTLTDDTKVIINGNKTNGSSSTNSTSGKVKTGDNTSTSLYMLLGMLGLVGFVATKKRKED